MKILANENTANSVFRATVLQLMSIGFDHQIRKCDEFDLDINMFTFITNSTLTSA